MLEIYKGGVYEQKCYCVCGCGCGCSCLCVNSVENPRSTATLDADGLLGQPIYTQLERGVRYDGII